MLKIAVSDDGKKLAARLHYATIALQRRLV